MTVKGEDEEEAGDGVGLLRDVVVFSRSECRSLGVSDFLPFVEPVAETATDQTLTRQNTRYR